MFTEEDTEHNKLNYCSNKSLKDTSNEKILDMVNKRISLDQNTILLPKNIDLAPKCLQSDQVQDYVRAIVNFYWNKHISCFHIAKVT